MHPMLLVHAASNINNVINFIEGVGFREALSAIGDNEAEAALLAMQNTERARDVKREVESAVNHLQSAHIAYRSIWRQIYGSDFSRWIRLGTMELVTRKDAYVSCLMALCYVYLGEFQLAQDCVAFVKEAKYANDWNIGDSTENQIMQALGTAFREPGKFIEAVKEQAREEWLDVESFGKAIEQYR